MLLRRDSCQHPNDGVCQDEESNRAMVTRLYMGLLHRHTMHYKPKQLPPRGSQKLADETNAAIDHLAAINESLERARQDRLSGETPYRPLGAFSTLEYAAKCGISYDAARGFLHRQYNRGRYERFLVRMASGTSVRAVYVYREKKANSEAVVGSNPGRGSGESQRYIRASSDANSKKKRR